jgi:hypothetical protein
MKRTLPWALVALYPFAILALVGNAPDMVASAFPQTEFFVKYWWIVVGGTILVEIIYFALHALSNSVVSIGHRILWLLVILFLPPFAIAAYWWTYSNHE